MTPEPLHPGAVLNVILAAHKNGDTATERAGRRLLDEQYGIRLILSRSGERLREAITLCRGDGRGGAAR